MVVEQESAVTFAGSDDEQQIAGRALAVMQAQGRFMARNAPIRVSIGSLAAFFASQDGASAEAVEAAIAANPAVFSVEERGEERLVVTTAAGHVPVVQVESTAHSFAARLMTPQPKPERPAVPPRERPLVAPSWTTYAAPFDLEDEVFEDELEVAEAEPDAVAEPLPTVAPEPEPEPAAARADAAVVSAAVSEVVEVAAPTIEEERVAAVEAVDAEPAAATEPERVAEVEVVEAVDEPVAPEAPVETVVEPVTPIPTPVRRAPAPAPAPLRLSDVSGFDDTALAAAIEARLRQDPRAAHFGDDWLAEDRVPRLSRGEMRRIKDYIDEQEQPLTDAMLAADILNVRPNAPDFDLARFAINVRLSREHRDFDFVGTNGQRFWSTSSLPQIGTTRRRPNEIGTDYRYLLDEVEVATVEPRSVRSVDHVLTFYEYTLGLLPYDADMQRLLPQPLLPDQRSAVLTLDCPQSYTTYLVELRYPTPNRGGFLLGLDDFFSENLVPGALISITATENDGHYRLEYLAGDNQNGRLLELDDRRTVRYVFRPTSFSCTVAGEMLISEERFPSLGSERPLDDRVRRRPEAVVHATFDRIGIDTGAGTGKLAAFDDLLAAVNIERPFSPQLLRTTLEGDAQITTDDGGDTYTDATGAGA